MQFHFSLMSQSDAEKIADWHYEGIYSFYDMENDPEDLQELLSPEKRGENYWSVFSNGVLIGFVALFRDDLSMEIGLGLRPDLTGKGLGSTFLDEIEQFILDYFPTVSKLRLSVASFNIRAQKVYQCAGFLPCKQEMITTNGGEYPFLIMEKYLFNT